MTKDEILILLEETQEGAGRATRGILEYLQNKENSLKDRGLVLANGWNYASEESYYCGPDNRRDLNISLYDDFYWDRHETCNFPDLLEMTIEQYLEDEDVDVDYDLVVETDEFWEWIDTSTVAKAVVIKDLIDNCIGKATHDW